MKIMDLVGTFDSDIEILLEEKIIPLGLEKCMKF